MFALGAGQDLRILGQPVIGRLLDVDLEDRSFPEFRAHLHGVVQEKAEPLHDREAKAKSAAPVSRRVVELMILFKDGLELIFGYPNARIPDLDADNAFPTTTPEQHPAPLGIFDRI